MLSRSRPDEEILQVDAALSQPGGIVVKEQRESCRLVSEIRYEHFSSRPLSEQSVGEILLGDGRLSGLSALVLSELENEVAYERDVFLRRLNDACFSGAALHWRIIRLAESGVNAIFRE